MDAFSGFLRRVLGALNRSGLNYVLTGALAASYYGRPRTTLDVDVIVVVRREDLAALARTLSKANLDVQQEKLLAAWKSKYRLATIEDRKGPHTLDIIFTDQKLDRNAGRILGVATYYQTAESLILAKLRMLKATLQVERAATDREDIKAILETKQVNLTTLRRRARAQSSLKILDDLITQASLKTLKGKYKGLIKTPWNSLEEKAERLVKEGKR